MSEETNFNKSLREDLFRRLIPLLPAQFRLIMAQYGMPAAYVPPNTSVEKQIITLLQYAEQREGGLQKLASIVMHGEELENSVQSVVNDIGALSQSTIQAIHLPELETALGRLQSIVERTKVVSNVSTNGEIGGFWHEGVNKHFSELFIPSYRCLKQLQINKLSRINLFAGVNNSGKTTLLEAVYLLTHQNHFGGLVEIIRRRSKIPQNQLDNKWLLEQILGDIQIHGVFDGSKTRVSIKCSQEKDTKLDKSRYLNSVKINAIFRQKKPRSVTHIFEGRDRETSAGYIKLICPIVYSSPFFLNEPHHYANFYYRSTQSKSLPLIFEFIQSTFLPTLKDIRLVDEHQRFLVDDSNFSSSLDLMNYGEGLQRIFFISLLFASAANGIVLIDEFENAIHTELIGNFAGFIHQLAKQFNVQVFLTSHSKEAIDAFIKNVSRTEANDFAFHALVKDEGKIVAREYDGKKFQRLIEIGDIDLRRTQ